MRKGSVRIIKIIFAAIALFFSLDMTCQAEEVYRNPDTGYAVVVEDECEFLSETKKAEVIEIMKEISAYGNVIFWSSYVENKSKDVTTLAEDHYAEAFGDTKGIILFVDGRFSRLYIYAHAEMYDVITNSHAQTIADRGHRYLKMQSYGTGAVEAYTQILSLLEEQSIIQPLKMVSGVLLGLFIGCLLTYAWVMGWYKKHLPKPEDKAEMFTSDIRFVNMRMTGETMEKTYYPLGTIFRAYPKGIDSINYSDRVQSNRGGFRR